MSETEFATPEQAEAAFYRAFEELDLDLMRRVWGTGTQIVCLHPGGDLVVGIQQVLDSWRRILQGARPPSLVFRLIQAQGDDATRVHLVEELIRPAGDTGSEPNRVLATNVYRRERDGWRLQLHHASLPVVRVKTSSEQGKRRLH